MMIRVEKVTIYGAEFTRTYSDDGMMISRDGEMYSEAIDPIGTGRKYTETDVPIEQDPQGAK